MKFEICYLGYIHFFKFWNEYRYHFLRFFTFVGFQIVAFFKDIIDIINIITSCQGTFFWQPQKMTAKELHILRDDSQTSCSAVTIFMSRPR